MNKKLLPKTLQNTTLAVVYIFLVSQVIQNGDKLFGKGDNFFTPFVVLMLLSLSAATVGSLVFGQSVFLFFDNKKKESIASAIYSIGWLALYTVLGIAILVVLH